MSIRSKSYKKSKIVSTETLLTKINPITSLNALSDVNSAGTVDQDLLKYNTSSSKWSSFRNPFIQSYIRVGSNAGQTDQNNTSIALGFNAGSNSQGIIGEQSPLNGNAIAIGKNAGMHSQCSLGIAIGLEAGSNNQSNRGIAIGFRAGKTNQNWGIAIGDLAGEERLSNYAIALGTYAGNYDAQPYSISIGYEAGYSETGSNSISIGYRANKTGNFYSNNIVINASNGSLDAKKSDRTYINPIRNHTETFDPTVIVPMLYNLTTKEVSASINHTGYLQIIPQDSGDVSADSCCGRVIYSTTSGGTLTLPTGVTGMNVFFISGFSSGSINLAIQPGDSLNGVDNGTHTLDVAGSHPHIHWLICAEDNKWFIMD